MGFDMDPISTLRRNVAKALMACSLSFFLYWVNGIQGVLPFLSFVSVSFAVVYLVGLMLDMNRRDYETKALRGRSAEYAASSWSCRQMFSRPMASR